jgi:hypothetical protein
MKGQPMDSPYATDWERRQHERDNGRHAAAAQAFLRLHLILEHDEDSPAPVLMSHAVENGKTAEILWGIAALPGEGDKAGCAAVDAWAARYHVAASWTDGRYRAVMHLGGGYRYGVFYMPERTLHPVPEAREDTPVDAPALAQVA